MQEFFCVNNKSLEVVNSACQSMVLQSGSLKVIGQFSLNGIGCLTFLSLSSVIGRFRSIYCQSDRSVRVPFVSFVYHVDKSLVRRRCLLTSLKSCLL